MLKRQNTMFYHELQEKIEKYVCVIIYISTIQAEKL